jgi:uncharacterized membrane protein
MGKNKGKPTDTHTDPAAGRGRPDCWEEKRRRFAAERQGSRGLGPRFFVTTGVATILMVFVALMTFRNTSTPPASAAVLQQVPASTATTENGRVGITVQEVTEKKLVAWDYKRGDTTVPLLAYTTPSGAVKIAVRMCEPCNGFSFHIEGDQIVCNTCGTRWDLESSKGISGGCLGYPPEVLPSSVVGGKITVDEQKLASWKPRV